MEKYKYFFPLLIIEYRLIISGVFIILILSTYVLLSKVKYNSPM